MSKIQLAVHGACGRMGQQMVKIVQQCDDVEIAAALESSTHPKLGEDIGDVAGLGPLGVNVSDELSDQVQIVFDASVPEATVHLAERCKQRELPLLVVTTGLDQTQRRQVEEISKTCPLLIASNCSLVVNLLMKLVHTAGEVLAGKDFDVEIVERHHRFKADAPSGTALSFAQILEDTMNLTQRVYGRKGITPERPRHEIGIHALRTGDNVGEHTIVFSTLGETLELVHKGHNRESYIRGALEAVRFLNGKSAGLYTMAHVLGLEPLS